MVDYIPKRIFGKVPRILRGFLDFKRWTRVIYFKTPDNEKDKDIFYERLDILLTLTFISTLGREQSFDQ